MLGHLLFTLFSIFQKTLLNKFFFFSRDNTLFAITSKRASPVEIAAEAVEEIAKPFYVEASSSDLKRTKSSNIFAKVNIDPPNKEGVVRISY